VQPLGSSGTFAVTDLRLATLDAYLEDNLPTKLASGTVQLRRQLPVRPAAAGARDRAAVGQVRDLSLAERGARPPPRSSFRRSTWTASRFPFRAATSA
jgi:hypothetical protein